MNTLLRHVAWMLCGWIATGAGAGCSDQQGTSPLQSARTLGQTDMNPPDVGDMAIPGPTCEAANGLAADKRLLCVDFTTNGPPQIAGWTFPMNCGADTWKWTIIGGALTLEAFGTFGDPALMNPVERACSFTSPLIDATSYKSLTLSIEQSVDLRIDKDVQQRAQILLESMSPPPTLLAESTGKTPSLRRSTVTISASEVQDKSLKFNLVTRSLSGGGYSGWQIRSIAVLGHK